MVLVRTKLSRVIPEMLIIFVLPVLLLYFKIIPISYRLWLTIPVTLLIIHSVVREKWSLKKLGIRIDNLRSSFLPYLTFTLVGVGIIFLFIKLTGRTYLDEYWKLYHFQGLFVLISTFQEFAFRGYLIPKLKSFISSDLKVILINSLLFSLLHIIFPNPWLMLPLAFLAGVAFSTMYKFFPNLILISISHSILNFVAVLYCLFSFAVCR